MSRSIALAAALLLPMTALPSPALAQQAQPALKLDFKIDRARIDKALAEMVSAERAAGVSALIWQGGRERYFGLAGFADREAKRPMARDTLVQIYSMTKPVTGVALMQLWEQGKFGLDDPVERYLPEFANARFYAGKDAAGVPLYRPATRAVTIRDIMRHTAGLSYGFGDTPVDLLFRQTQPLGLDHDLAEAGRRIGPLPLLFDPGGEWSYSSGVDVQALLVEKLSGEAFEPYVRKHILDPLGMRESGWTQPEERFARLARAYVTGADGKLARQPDEALRALNFAPRKLNMGGAGIVGPIDEYMRFARMLLAGGSLDGARILKPSTVRLMATDHLDPRITKRHFLPSKGNVGFGLDFAVRVGQPKDAAEPRGAVGEFFWDGAASTLFWVDPANDLAAVFFVQKLPHDSKLTADFRKAVYGADYLGPVGD